MTSGFMSKPKKERKLMRNLFHQTLGFVLGLAFGLLGVVSAVSLFVAYIAVDSKPKPVERKSYKDYLKDKEPVGKTEAKA